MELTVRGPTQTWPQPWFDRVFPAVRCHRPGVDMAEGTRGEGRKGPGHSSRALTGFGGVDGKVLILKILGNVQIQRQSHSSPYGDLLPKASFSRDINLGQIRVQLKGRDAPIVSLQPRCVCHEDLS
jgi:hypothetical protein